NKAQIRGENQVAKFFLLEVIVLLNPLMHFDIIGRLVTRLDKSALNLLRIEIEIHKLLPASPRISRLGPGARMLLRIRRICGVKGTGKNRMAGHVMSPVIEGYSPGIGAGITAESSEPLRVRAQTEPSRVIHSCRAVWSFHLGM